MCLSHSVGASGCGGVSDDGASRSERREITLGEPRELKESNASPAGRGGSLDLHGDAGEDGLERGRTLLRDTGVVGVHVLQDDQLAEVPQPAVGDAGFAEVQIGQLTVPAEDLEPGVGDVGTTEFKHF